MCVDAQHEAWVCVAEVLADGEGAFAGVEQDAGVVVAHGVTAVRSGDGDLRRAQCLCQTYG